MCICFVYLAAQEILSGMEGVKLTMQCLQDLTDVKKDLLVPTFWKKAKQQWLYMFVLAFLNYFLCLLMTASWFVWYSQYSIRIPLKVVEAADLEH